MCIRDSTGEGQRIEVDLMRSSMALESQEFMMLLNSDVKYERPDSGIAHPVSYTHLIRGIWKSWGTRYILSNKHQIGMVKSEKG